MLQKCLRIENDWRLRIESQPILQAVLSSVTMIFGAWLINLAAAATQRAFFIDKPAWHSSAWLHSAWALGIVLYMATSSPQCLFRLQCTARSSAPWWIKRWPFLPFLSAGAILAGVTLLGLGTRLLVPNSQLTGGVHVGSPNLPPWQFIFWIPLVEEAVYRAGVGEIFQRYAPGWLGIWCASGLFALVHTPFTIEELFTGQLGFALGPFLLGLFCGTVYHWLRNLWAAVAIHASCNATVALFALVDPRWLDWLQVLYS